MSLKEQSQGAVKQEIPRLIQRYRERLSYEIIIITLLSLFMSLLSLLSLFMSLLSLFMSLFMSVSLLTYNGI